MSLCIGVVGLWHLGCTIAGSWLELGYEVVGVDFDKAVVEQLRSGRAPLFEPGLDAILAAGLASGALRVSFEPASVRGCRFVFIAHDTPVREDDTSDLSPIWGAVETCGPHLDPGAIVIISAQLPVGTARRVRERLRQLDPSLEVVYSPENLRLGEAIAWYLKPGHIVIGAENPETAAAVETLFTPMQARVFRMNLPSAEMTKHCINSFLGASVTLANQWTDIAAATGADFAEIAPVLRADPRIGERAYITPGIGFSGGTLGRDLRVLDEVSRERLGGAAPLFGDMWRYNQRRIEVVARRAAELLGGVAGRRIALMGMTYKAGTSTLRRSLALAVARDLLACGAQVAAHDPRADWSEVERPDGLLVAPTPYAASEGADLMVLLTEWPEYRELDFVRLAQGARSPWLLDTKGFFHGRAAELAAAGLQLVGLTRAEAARRE